MDFFKFFRLGFLGPVVLFWWLFGATYCLDDSEFRQNFPEKIIWGIPSKTAELPCDITPPVPSDNVKMVFWFKDDIGMPLYSLDARNGLQNASHLTVSGDLGDRLYFVLEDGKPSLARLRVENVSKIDQGMYRCRVDFVDSPTRNFKVNLTMIEQPSSPRVFDAEGMEIKTNSSAGPFLEGKELFLSCQVNGGIPRPTVTWWHGDTLLDGVVDTSSNSLIIVNQLYIAEVTRNFKAAKLLCKATSSEDAGYLTRVIPLVVYLKPNKVKIVSPNELMSSRKPHNVKCETSGSYPPAKITWLLDGKTITQSVITEEETDTFTASIVSLSVSADDDGKELVCRADNPRFPGGKALDSRKIHVAYPPKVRVKLVEESEAGPAKEGSEVKMRCEGRARPSPHNYRWYHNDHQVQFNSTSGVFPMDETLVIRHVDSKSAGRYACSAANTEGETYSAPYELQVQFKPKCKRGYQESKVGLIADKNLQVQCHVESIPEVRRFYWTYNTSRDVQRVESTKFQNKGSVSTLILEPSTNREEISSLACWATNELGRQEEPCLFLIVPADVPERPRNCFYKNASTIDIETTIHVICRPGKDGGLPQTFVLEVNDVTSSAADLNQVPPGVTTLSDEGEVDRRPAYRILGERPEFEVTSLKPGREYKVSVYAENEKGRSEPSEMMPSIRVPQALSGTKNKNSTESRLIETQSDNSSTPTTNLTPIYVVLTSCLVILFIVIVTAVSILACRKPTPEVEMRQKSRKLKGVNDDYEIHSEAGFGEGFHRRSAQYRASMYGNEDDVEMRISRIVDRPDLILSPRGLNNMNEDEM